MSLATRRLTDAHRRAQNKIAAEIVMQMRAIWPLLDPKDLDATFQRWLTAAIPLVQAHRSTSAHLAANYLATIKRVQVGIAADHNPVLSDRANPRQLATALMVTGPVSVKRAMLRAVPLDRALDIAEGASAAAAMRLVLDGGRETIVSTVAADKDAQGWARSASGKACDFCAALDGRVFSKDTADFPAHDGCACSAEPVYG